jgi:hypothetical protein
MDDISYDNYLPILNSSTLKIEIVPRIEYFKAMEAESHEELMILAKSKFKPIRDVVARNKNANETIRRLVKMLNEKLNN